MERDSGASMDSKRLAGKVALVTGGAAGIGAATGQVFAAQGAQVVLSDITDGEAVANAIGLEATFHHHDVTSKESWTEVVAFTVKTFGHLDVLVNCAGITRDGTLRKMDSDQWGAVLSVNLDSVFNMTRQAIDGMMERGFGRIVNISSVNGQKGQFGQTNYSAAKAGMHGFTMALALEAAAKGVTVNSISPGYVATRMVMAIPQEVRDQIIAQIPVGRLGRPEEIAAAVAFCASEEMGFMTGANLALNGGLHMQF